jgi:15-cis-phytoene synthase
MPEALSPQVRAALEQCRWMIAKGSKSFSLAAKLFEPENRHAAFFLYGWCRYCDDQVDDAAKQGSRDEMERRLQNLKDSTQAAFSGAAQSEAVFIALQYIVQRYGIPSHYALELIEGMAMDVRGTRYRNFDELLLYCYRVAGTVGLMMSHVMGLRDQAALKHAADLGIAMQLTNIARDIIEDAGMGRVYLPLEWVHNAGIEIEQIDAPENRLKLAELARRLLVEAAAYYRSGDAGLWYLSFRSACAVSAARQVYFEIGSMLLKKGPLAWDQRTYVTGARKIWVVMRGVVYLLGSLPVRLMRPWSAAPIQMVWTYSALR